KIAAVGVTNQRETLCAFDREGNPLRRAIVWQCRRSFAICENLKKAGHERLVHEKTGLVLDPYFSASKITWMIENDPALAKQLRQRKALLGTIDTFLLFKLTNGTSFVTEPSNASRTAL